MHFKRMGAVIAVLVLLPIAASAQTNQQLEQQMANLLAQLNALQALLGTAQDTRTGSIASQYAPVSTLIDGSIPLSLPNDLNTGDNNYSITLLQQHLARDPNIYPEALVTGFYGPMTTAAIRRFQIACGLVTVGNEASTGFGRVGPRTRQALQFGCSASTAVAPPSRSPFNAGNLPTYDPQTYPPSQTYPPPPTLPPVISPIGPVYPTSGPLPLTVAVQAKFTTLACNIASTTYRTYRINYGDGEYQDVQYKISGSADPDCGREIVRTGTHTYHRLGSYTIKLEEIGPDSSNNVTVLNSLFLGYVTAGGSGTESLLPPTIQVHIDSSPTEIARGNTASIAWTSVNAPSNSAVRLQLHRSSDGSLVSEGGIVNDLPVSGVYTWQIPLLANNIYCPPGTGMLCPNYITENTSYRVRAFLYEPRGACWGTSCYGGSLAYSRAIANTDAFTVLPYGAVAGSAFTATPDNGAAPLAVVFSIQTNQGGACTAGNYSIDFGDGSAKQDLAIGITCGVHVFAVSHTYTSGGTWTAKFYNMPASSVTSNTTPNATRVITVTGTAT